MGPNPLLSSVHDFCWATGIEDTFIPQARPGLRPLDEYELTQHYQQYEQDFALAASTGVRAVRWGIPWYRVEPEPGRFDWEWTDRALELLVAHHKLVPILDLMHYGTPLWLENSFINAHYAERVAEYAAAVVERYQELVQVYTPLNEPMVNADMCGRRGEWPPYLEGDDGYVKLVIAICRGIVKTVEAIRSVQPDAFLVQVEALWRVFIHGGGYHPRVEFDNARQYLAFDLSAGRVGEGYPLLDFLYKNGVTDSDLRWFKDNAVSFDVFGANYYPWSNTELVLDEAGKLQQVKSRTHGGTIAEVLTDAFERYRMPVMVTETSARENIEGRRLWMDETLSAVWQLRQQGIPVVGYTWFPMMTMIDWAYRVGDLPLETYLLHLGLFESSFDEQGILQRYPTSLVNDYRQLIQQPVPPLNQVSI